MKCFIYILYNFLIQKAVQITNVSIVILFDTLQLNKIGLYDISHSPIYYLILPSLFFIRLILELKAARLLILIEIELIRL